MLHSFFYTVCLGILFHAHFSPFMFVFRLFWLTVLILIIQNDCFVFGVYYIKTKYLSPKRERGLALWQEHSLIVWWVVGSILYGVFLVPASALRLVYQSCGMCYPVCGMVHIKEPLLLIGKSSLCSGSSFPLSLSEWFFTICLMPYNRK